MNKLLAVICAALAVGCASQEEMARRRVQVDKARTDLDRAMADAVVTCSDRPSCDKAFALAKLYVQESSNMKVQFSDETTVFTYNPTKYCYVGLRATRVPGAGQSSTIRLSANCKGFDDGFDGFRDCAHRMEMIYRGFRPYIEPRL